MKKKKLKKGKQSVSTLAGLFKEMYAGDITSLFPAGFLYKMLDSNYDPVIEDMFNNSCSDLKETLGYKKDV